MSAGCGGGRRTSGEVERASEHSLSYAEDLGLSDVLVSAGGETLVRSGNLVVS